VKWLLALALAAGCSKSTEPPPKPDKPGPAIPQAEVRRATEACEGYATRVCACAETQPKAKTACELSRGQVEAIAIAERLASNPQAAREDALQAADSIRKTTKACVEMTAQLVELGCP
jgi:hypothetical protein